MPPNRGNRRGSFAAHPDVRALRERFDAPPSNGNWAEARKLTQSKKAPILGLLSTLLMRL
jgi:hypothetical protein